MLRLATQCNSAGNGPVQAGRRALHGHFSQHTRDSWQDHEMKCLLERVAFGHDYLSASAGYAQRVKKE
eukprot:6444010-Amphidinium_carterae.3